MILVSITQREIRLGGSLTELSKYQKVIVKLGLVGDCEAEQVFQYVCREYPEPTEESCEKLVGMLALLFPDLDYTGLVEELFPDDEDNPTRRERAMGFIKGLIKIKE